MESQYQKRTKTLSDHEIVALMADLVEPCSMYYGDEAVMHTIAAMHKKRKELWEQITMCRKLLSVGATLPVAPRLAQLEQEFQQASDELYGYVEAHKEKVKALAKIGRPLIRQQHRNQ